MNIVTLNGSPNKNGNTAFLLTQASDYLKNKYAVKITNIDVAAVMSKQKNPFCVVCSNPCSGLCYIDTELEEAFNIVAESDGVIIGSPVYFGTVSAQLKAFWDKSRKVRGEKKFLNLVGGAVTVGAARYGGQETTMKAIFDMMLVQGMIIVGDGQQNTDCGHQGVAAQRPVETDLNSLKRVEILAERIYEVAVAMKKLRKC